MRKNVAKVWIDYKKAYDMVQQTWIIECMNMYKISDKVINYISIAMESGKVELAAGGQTLAVIISENNSAFWIII